MREGVLDELTGKLVKALDHAMPLSAADPTQDFPGHPPVVGL